MIGGRRGEAGGGWRMVPGDRAEVGGGWCMQQAGEVRQAMDGGW